MVSIAWVEFLGGGVGWWTVIIVSNPTSIVVVLSCIEVVVGVLTILFPPDHLINWNSRIFWFKKNCLAGFYIIGIKGLFYINGIQGFLDFIKDLYCHLQRLEIEYGHPYSIGIQVFLDLKKNIVSPWSIDQLEFKDFCI